MKKKEKKWLQQLNTLCKKESPAATQDELKKSNISKILNQKITFCTHQTTDSNAEILINQDLVPDTEQIQYFEIIQNGISFIVQKDPDTTYSKVKSLQANYQVSIMKSIVEQFDIQYEQGNKFNGVIRQLDKQNTNKYALDKVEILINKDQFVSRRDQYDLSIWLKGLNDVKEDLLSQSENAKNSSEQAEPMTQIKGTVVYCNKQIFMNNIKYTISCLAIQNQVVKCGLITKATNIIFRSCCNQMTIMIEISKDMFEFDTFGEIHWEKMQKFIRIFFQRLQFYQTNHRLQCVIYARLFYPQYKNLNDIYYNLYSDAQNRISNSSGNLKNYTFFGFQIDNCGNIYQDIYRKIHIAKSTRSLDRLVSVIWKKITEFIYAINWQIQANSIVQKLTASFENNAQTIVAKSSDPAETAQSTSPTQHPGQHQPLLFQQAPPNQIQSPHQGQLQHSATGAQAQQPQSSNNLTKQVPKSQSHNLNDKKGPLNSKTPIKQLWPQCELAFSSKSNILEAINMVAIIYSSHQVNRSTLDSGHSIMILTSGQCQYHADQQLYKMVKQQILLNNIQCSLISFRNKPFNMKTPTFMFGTTGGSTLNSESEKKRDEIKSENWSVYDRLIYRCIENTVLEMQNIKQLKSILEFKEDIFRNRLQVKYHSEKETNLHVLNQAQFEQQFQGMKLNCNHQQHYYIPDERVRYSSRVTINPQIDNPSQQVTKKTPYWIECQFITDLFYKIHLILYDKFPFVNPLHSQITYQEKKVQQQQAITLNYLTVQKFKDTEKLFFRNQSLNQLNKSLEECIRNQSMKKKFEDLAIQMQTGIKTEKDKTTKIIHSQNDHTLHFEKLNEDQLQSVGKLSATYLGKQVPLDNSEELLPESHPNIFNLADYTRVESLEDRLTSSQMSESFSKQPVMSKSPDLRINQGVTMPKEQSQQNVQSHYRCRQEANDMQSLIHCYNHQFSDEIKAIFNKVMNDSLASKKEQDQNKQAKYLKYTSAEWQHFFNVEKVWKNLYYPLLYPIQTKYSNQFMKYQNHQYQLTKDMDLLIQLIKNRLAHNFQIVTSHQESGFGKFIKLEKGNESHKIYYSEQNNLKIEISRKFKQGRSFNKEVKKVELPSILYSYLVFDEKNKMMQKKQAQLQNVSDFDWNRFDNYYDELFSRSFQSNTIDFTRKLIQCKSNMNKLILIPQDKLDAEGLGIRKMKSRGEYKEHLAKVRADRESRLKKIIKGICDKYPQINKKICPENIQCYGKIKEMFQEYVASGIRSTQFNYQDIWYQDIDNKINSNSKDVFLFEYQKQWCYKATYHMNIYWQSISATVINDFLKSLNTITRNNNYLCVSKPQIVDPDKYVQKMLNGVSEERIFSQKTLYYDNIFENSAIIQVSNSNIIKMASAILPQLDFVYCGIGPSNNYAHVKGQAFVILDAEENSILWRDNQLIVDCMDLQDLEDMYSRLRKHIIAVEVVDSIITAATNTQGTQQSQYQRKGSSPTDSQGSPIKLRRQTTSLNEVESQVTHNASNQPNLNLAAIKLIPLSNPKNDGQQKQ